MRLRIRSAVARGVSFSELTSDERRHLHDGFRMRSADPTVDRIREADAALHAKLAKTRG